MDGSEDGCELRDRYLGQCQGGYRVEHLGLDPAHWDSFKHDIDNQDLDKSCRDRHWDDGLRLRGHGDRRRRSSHEDDRAGDAFGQQQRQELSKQRAGGEWINGNRVITGYALDANSCLNV
jgi:hypothetical protein